MISLVRHPVDRCLSHFYHLGVRDYANITDDNILDFARRRCINYMAEYLGKPHDSSAEEILRRFDFVGTTERFDESMILLQQRLPMPVRLGDILYVKAKKSSEREKRGKGVMHKPYAQQSKRVRDFFNIDFKTQSNLDFALYQLVNTSLDNQGKSMGLGRLVHVMSKYTSMLAIADKKCATDKRQDDACFWGDNGCMISCLDSIGAYSYVRNSTQNMKRGVLRSKERGEGETKERGKTKKEMLRRKSRKEARKRSARLDLG